MSYRVSHHSTSDDSSAYRSMEEVDSIKKDDSPIMRLRGYLDSRSLWSDEQEEKYKSSIKKMVIKEFNLAEKESKPELSSMFEDVFAGGAELERPLREQKEELQRLVRKYGSTTAWKKRLEKFEGGQERFLA